MTGYLFPRLQSGAARLYALRFENMTPMEAANSRSSAEPEDLLYAPTGGPRIVQSSLQDLRHLVIESASRCGYPTERSLEDQRAFDLRLAELVQDWPIIPGEALRDEVWQYLTCVIVPDAVIWRFGSKSQNSEIRSTHESRFLGGNRNLLQRAWWRGKILRDPTAAAQFWLLDTSAHGLTEDNMVALLERPYIASHWELCRTIALEFAKYRVYVKDLPDSPEQTLLRELMKRVVRLAAYANIEVIDEDTRLSLVRNLFAETIRAMGGTPPAPGRVYRQIARRTLRPIDLPQSTSHQHEIQGVEAIRQLLGGDSRALQCRWRLLWKDGSMRRHSVSDVKWYDARKASPNRKGEWRLYYPPGTPMDDASERDMLLLATSTSDDDLHAFILPWDSPIYLQVLGALGNANSIEVSDEVEKNVRSILHARL